MCHINEHQRHHGCEEICVQYDTRHHRRSCCGLNFIHSEQYVEAEGHHYHDNDESLQQHPKALSRSFHTQSPCLEYVLSFTLQKMPYVATYDNCGRVPREEILEYVQRVLFRRGLHGRQRVDTENFNIFYDLPRLASHSRHQLHIRQSPENAV